MKATPKTVQSNALRGVGASGVNALRSAAPELGALARKAAPYAALSAPVVGGFATGNEGISAGTFTGSALGALVGGGLALGAASRRTRSLPPAFQKFLADRAAQSGIVYGTALGGGMGMSGALARRAISKESSKSTKALQLLSEMWGATKGTVGAAKRYGNRVAREYSRNANMAAPMVKPSPKVETFVNRVKPNFQPKADALSNKVKGFFNKKTPSVPPRGSTGGKSPSRGSSPAANSSADSAVPPRKPATSVEQPSPSPSRRVTVKEQPPARRRTQVEGLPAQGETSVMAPAEVGRAPTLPTASPSRTAGGVAPTPGPRRGTIAYGDEVPVAPRPAAAAATQNQIRKSIASRPPGSTSRPTGEVRTYERSFRPLDGSPLAPPTPSKFVDVPSSRPNRPAKAPGAQPAEGGAPTPQQQPAGTGGQSSSPRSERSRQNKYGDPGANTPPRNPQPDPTTGSGTPPRNPQPDPTTGSGTPPRNPQPDPTTGSGTPPRNPQPDPTTGSGTPPRNPQPDPTTGSGTPPRNPGGSKTGKVDPDQLTDSPDFDIVGTQEALRKAVQAGDPKFIAKTIAEGDPRQMAAVLASGKRRGAAGVQSDLMRGKNAFFKDPDMVAGLRESGLTNAEIKQLGKYADNQDYDGILSILDARRRRVTPGSSLVDDAVRKADADATALEEAAGKAKGTAGGLAEWARANPGLALTGSALGGGLVLPRLFGGGGGDGDVVVTG